MKAKPKCVICTRDEKLTQRLKGFLQFHADLEFLETAEETVSRLENVAACILLLDLRTENALEIISDLQKADISNPVICLGDIKSDPAIEAERLGIYALQNLPPARRELQNLVERAADYLLLKLENEMLQSKALYSEVQKPPELKRENHPSLSDVSKAFRCLDDINSLFEHVVKTVGSSVVASRVGLLTLDSEREGFSVRSSLRCLSEIGNLYYPEKCEFVSYLKNRAQLISRSQLSHVAEKNTRFLLLRTLDDHGADTILPLFGRNGLLGWLFLGPRATGIPYSHNDLETLMLMTENLSGTVEKAMLYEKAGLQKNLLETLFHSLPTGIIAMDEKNTVLWLNHAAEAMLNMAFDDLISQPVEKLGHHLAAYVNNFQFYSKDPLHSETLQLASGTFVEMRIRRLSEIGSHRGYLIILEDASTVLALKEEQERLTRSQMLAEMSQNMSFDIRGPLTAIKTFTQLLPERWDDPEFHEKFDHIVQQEVERLNELSDNICTVNKLASAPAVARQFMISECMDTVRRLMGTMWMQIEGDLEKNLPSIEGNPDRLAECLCHLLINAKDATVSQDRPKICLSVKKVYFSKNIEAIEFKVCDNRLVRTVGAFVDNSSLGSSESVRRADLRLSFACQIVKEHAGNMEMKTTENGVCVAFHLPTKGIT